MLTSTETILISSTIWTGTFTSKKPILDGQIDYAFLRQLAHDLAEQDDPMVNALVDIGEAHLHISRTSLISFSLSVIQDISTVTV